MLCTWFIEKIKNGFTGLKAQPDAGYYIINYYISTQGTIDNIIRTLQQWGEPALWPIAPFIKKGDGKSEIFDTTYNC